MDYTERCLNILKELREIEHGKLNQKKLHEIYEKEKTKDAGCYKHNFIEPTACPRCGNYRLDFGDKVYHCPQTRFCGEFWDDKLRLRLV